MTAVNSTTLKTFCDSLIKLAEVEVMDCLSLGGDRAMFRIRQNDADVNLLMCKDALQVYPVIPDYEDTDKLLKEMSNQMSLIARIDNCKTEIQEAWANLK